MCRLFFMPCLQQSANRSGIPPHVEHGDDRGDFRFDRPVDRFPKPFLESPGSFVLPGIIKGVRMTKVVLDEIEELDGLAFHPPTSLRSSSFKVMRFALPARYAFHRPSRRVLWAWLTGMLSSMPASQSSSASASFFRLGSFFRAGKAASAWRKPETCEVKERLRICASGNKEPVPGMHYCPARLTQRLNGQRKSTQRPRAPPSARGALRTSGASYCSRSHGSRCAHPRA